MQTWASVKAVPDTNLGFRCASSGFASRDSRGPMRGESRLYPWQQSRTQGGTCPRICLRIVTSASQTDDFRIANVLRLRDSGV